MSDDSDNAPFHLSESGGWTVVEFRTTSLSDSSTIERIQKALLLVITAEHKHRMVLDFAKVEFLSSQALGLLLAVHKETRSRPSGQLVLCGVSPKLLQLIQMVKLDRLLAIKPTQIDAIKTPLTH